ncbi:MAG TPA: hypothetical protein VHB20_18530 [Verrucomicrobiae bacterium]|nr:hypothetical protein [Verrucomicrobiae bacterium]
MAWWQDKIQFLPPGSAPWIVYPLPLDAHAIPALELPAEFRCQFVLPEKPAAAQLEWRCFKRGEIRINGTTITTNAAHWKSFSHAETASALRAGTNEIAATVWAGTGPPALCVKLTASEFILKSDTSWTVSWAGSQRLPAMIAGEDLPPRPGNGLFGFEQTGEALRRALPLEGLFAALAAAGVFAGWRLRRTPAICWLILAVAWVVLLAHNLPYRTDTLGFDARRHLEYADYIQKNHALPLAGQGWEMFQAPLNYILWSKLLTIVGAAAGEDAGLRALRCWNIAIGAATIALIAAGLALLFPGQWKKQIAGATLAAFAPWHLCLLHYTTNELLAGMWGAAALCLTLKCLQAESPPPRWCAALGVALGAACLTKASAVVLLPPIFVALACRLAARRAPPAAWLNTVGTALILTVAISGWHYARVWRHYGNPLAGNWDPAVFKAWWQQPGYLTPRYFLSFGRAFTSPFFSGFHSFWDALYTTMWGDGLVGGWSSVAGRPPWNYDLMTVGFVLALAPMTLTLAGAALMLKRLAQAPRAEVIILTGAPMLFLFAVAVMTLKLPFYAQAKSFYALAALLPCCALAVVGFDFFASRLPRWAMLALTLWLGLWLVNNYAAFWIKLDSAPARLGMAMAKYEDGRQDATTDFATALVSDPNNSTAAEYLAFAEIKAGQKEQSADFVQHWAARHPDDSVMDAMAAASFAQQGDLTNALRLIEHASALAPDDFAISQAWMRFAHAARREAETVQAGEFVLHDHPENVEAHKIMAEALLSLGQTNAANLHLGWARAARSP